MIRSMTGYGESARPHGSGVLHVALRAVNHRFLNVTVRMPPGFDRLESEVQSWLRPFLFRGHVQVAVSLDRTVVPREGALPELDVERARHYAGLLRRLHEELGLPGGPDVSAIVRFGDVFRAPESEARLLPDEGLLREMTEEAARALVAMREAEGRRLLDDMAERLRVMEVEVGRVAELAPERLLRERDRLRAAVRELAAQEDVDEERLAREVAYMAERWDVNEEVVRFRSHLQLFRDTLAGPGDEGMGKRLGFVVQEMHREANTMGAKANDAEIARSTVTMKEEIERLREQVENVE